MLNESTTDQAKAALLSRHTTIKEAFFSRTEDGIFSVIGKEYAPDEFDKDLQYHLWATNDRDKALAIAKRRRAWKGFEVLTNSPMLDV